MGYFNWLGVMEKSEKPVPGLIINKDFIASLLITTAQSQVGVRERGLNAGSEVQMYQRAVLPHFTPLAWCMFFQQWIILKTCSEILKYDPVAVSADALKNRIVYKTGGCVDMWAHVQEKYRLKSPAAGCMFINQKNGSEHGHTGLVKSVTSLPLYHTIEGNTDVGGSREGDGVYERTRSASGTPGFTTLGYVDTPQMLMDSYVQMKAIEREKLDA